VALVHASRAKRQLIGDLAQALAFVVVHYDYLSVGLVEIYHHGGDEVLMRTIDLTFCSIALNLRPMATGFRFTLSSARLHFHVVQGAMHDNTLDPR